MAAYYNVTIEDAGDGSGDGILTFPEQFLKDEGWLEGDEITFKRNQDKIIVINNSKELRDRVKSK